MLPCGRLSDDTCRFISVVQTGFKSFVKNQTADMAQICRRYICYIFNSKEYMIDILL